MNKALLQEWDVFRALCPDEIMSVITDYYAPERDYYQICYVIEKLGFDILACELKRIYAHGKNKYILDNDDSFLRQFSESSKYYTDMFLDSIKSPVLHDYFMKKIDSDS